MSTQSRYYCFLSAVAVAISTVTGCSSPVEAPPSLTPVSGRVLLDDKPVPAVAVTFIPLAGTPGTGGYGVANEEGVYEIVHRSDSPGVEPGQYAVTFSKITQLDGSPLPRDVDRTELSIVEHIPTVYTTYDGEVPLIQAEVAAPTSGLDFKLSSKAKPPKRI